MEKAQPVGAKYEIKGKGQLQLARNLQPMVCRIWYGQKFIERLLKAQAEGKLDILAYTWERAYALVVIIKKDIDKISTKNQFFC